MVRGVKLDTHSFNVWKGASQHKNMFKFNPWPAILTQNAPTGGVCHPQQRRPAYDRVERPVLVLVRAGPDVELSHQGILVVGGVVHVGGAGHFKCKFIYHK